MLREDITRSAPYSFRHFTLRLFITKSLSSGIGRVMLLLIRDELQCRLMQHVPRIGKGHFYQSNTLVQMVLKAIRERPPHWTAQDLQHTTQLSVHNK